MALFPVFPPPADPVAQPALCRPAPAGGCVSFLRYWRYTSNRLREYGPFERFIDRAKLVSALTYDDIVGKDRWGWAVKVPLLGTVEQPRFEYQDTIFPFAGMSCPTA